MEPTNPYSRPEAGIVHPAATDSAGRGERFAAALLDAILLMAIVFPIMFATGLFAAMMQQASAGPFAGMGTKVVAAAVGFAVFVVVQGFPLHRSGQTWGKRALGIRIVDLDGRQPSLTHLLTRRYLPVQVVNAIPLLGSVLSLVDVLLIFRADRRCGHDLIAGTQVVKVRTHAD